MSNLLKLINTKHVRPPYIAVLCSGSAVIHTFYFSAVTTLSFQKALSCIGHRTFLYEEKEFPGRIRNASSPISPICSSTNLV
jgi:hypothetical protein